MSQSVNGKPMRGRMTQGYDCPCCSSWGTTRASDKRELLEEARMGFGEYKQEYTDFIEEKVFGEIE